MIYEMYNYIILCSYIVYSIVLVTANISSSPGISHARSRFNL